MSARDAILRALRANKPAPVPLPDAAPSPADAPLGDAVDRFAALVERIGGRVLRVPRAEVAAAVRRLHPDAAAVASTVPEVDDTVGAVADPHDLAALDLFVAEGGPGVAENGAVWLDEASMPHRAAPFIAEHVVLVVAAGRIVETMHDAYARPEVGRTGFGVFVAGPSKTADIEQALVIGAHGPRSLTVLVV